MASNTIEKLNSTNYAGWSIDMKYVLIEKGLWDIIESGKEELTLSTKVTDSDVSNFKQRSRQALSAIFLNIEGEFKRVIAECTNAVQAWKKIRLHFHPDSRSFLMKSFSELIECRKKEGESINIFATRLRRLMNIIKEQDKGFNEIYLSFQLIRYLPRKYDSIVQSILRWSEDDFKFEKIVLELVSEETRLTVRDQDSFKCAPTANSVKYKQKPRFSKKCWHCGMSGHVRSKCRKYLSSRYNSNRQSHPTYAESSPSHFRSSSDFSPTMPRGRGSYRHDYRNSSTDSNASRSFSRDSRQCPRSPSPRPYRGSRNCGKNPISGRQPRKHRADVEDFSDSSHTLEWLKLGGNQLTKVPQHAFRNLSRLRQLDLRSNKLTKVEIDSFAEYGKTLKFIFLQKNSIQTIDHGSFEILESAQWMYIHSNQLTSLHYETFKPVIDNLHVLDLHGNPFDCNCEVMWFREWLLSKGQNVVNLPKETRCNTPEEHAQKPIVKLNNNSFVCSCGNSVSSKMTNNIGTFSIFFLSVFMFFMSR